MRTLKRVDRPFFITVVLLVAFGFLIFMSAALGLLAREESARFSSIALKQIVFGIALGSAALLLTLRVPYRAWKKYAPHIFLLSIAVSLLVFVPGIGLEFGGAKRWIALGPFSFQPAELLKFGFVLYLAAWLSGVRTRIREWRYGIVPFLLILAAAGAPLLLQPDTGTFIVVFAAGVAMFVASGARWRDIFALCGVSVIGLAVLAFIRPYIKTRLLTFFDPSADPLGASYQLQQSLIAIGSGEWFGRGFGQGVQKFNFLPEPISDSIFAVAAEEFGFVGSIVIIGLFIFLCYRGLAIAARAPDYFGGLLAVGIVILIVFQSFANIGSMLGVLPLTGLPLLFVSHGGSAMLFALAEIGIVLNISTQQRS